MSEKAEPETHWDDDSSAFECRYYEGEFPEADEVVMANVTEIGEMGAYVTLLEYDNKEVQMLYNVRLHDFMWKVYISHFLGNDFVIGIVEKAYSFHK